MAKTALQSPCTVLESRLHESARDTPLQIEARRHGKTTKVDAAVEPAALLLVLQTHREQQLVAPDRTATEPESPGADSRCRCPSPGDLRVAQPRGHAWRTLLAIAGQPHDASNSSLPASVVLNAARAATCWLSASRSQACAARQAVVTALSSGKATFKLSEARRRSIATRSVPAHAATGRLRCGCG